MWDGGEDEWYSLEGADNLEVPIISFEELYLEIGFLRMIEEGNYEIDIVKGWYSCLDPMLFIVGQFLCIIISCCEMFCCPIMLVEQFNLFLYVMFRNSLILEFYINFYVKILF